MCVIERKKQQHFFNSNEAKYAHEKRINKHMPYILCTLQQLWVVFFVSQSHTAQCKKKHFILKSVKLNNKCPIKIFIEVNKTKTSLFHLSFQKIDYKIAGHC